jgi:hypothetical protein
MKYEKYKELLAAKYSLDVLWGLKFLKDGEEVPENIKQGIKRKGWVDENNIITPLGEGMLGYLEGDGEANIKHVTSSKNEMDIITPDFFSELHKKLQDKLIELTGKKQKVISGKYSFLPNATDLRIRLEKVIKKYHLENELEKIEKVLLKHIEQSHKAGWQMVVLLDYYISKDNTSRMVTALEGNEEKEENYSTETLI